jgi:glycosyl transferase family 87
MHAMLAAVVMWIVAAVIAFAGPGYRSIFGPLKGSDFIQFYTLGHLDARTAPATLYNPAAFYQLQTQLVPESSAERYLIVYPPHVTLLFRPLAVFSYGRAALLWAAILAALYAVCVWLAWRPVRNVLDDWRLLIAAAAAFPPFWYLVLHGQTTVVPLLAFCLGWMALERRRSFLAGMAFGLLMLKPQFALVLVVLTLICGEWAMVAGAAVSVGLQVAGTAALLGTSVLWDYATLVTRLPLLRELLAPRPEQMHSISALTDRLPDDWGVILWALLSAAVMFRTVQVWRLNVPVAVRMGILVLGSVLVNPHVFVYDLTVLAPALVWFAGWACAEAQPRLGTSAVLVPLIYALYLSLLFPTAVVLPIQASVFVLGGLFVVVSSDLLRSRTEALATSRDIRNDGYDGQRSAVPRP